MPKGRESRALWNTQPRSGTRAVLHFFLSKRRQDHKAAVLGRAAALALRVTNRDRTWATHPTQITARQRPKGAPEPQVAEAVPGQASSQSRPYLCERGGWRQLTQRQRVQGKGQLGGPARRKREPSVWGARAAGPGPPAALTTSRCAAGRARGSAPPRSAAASWCSAGPRSRRPAAPPPPPSRRRACQPVTAPHTERTAAP